MSPIPIKSAVPSFVQIDYVPAAEQGVDLTVTYQDASPPGIRTSVDRVASVGIIQVSTQSLPENGVLSITVRDQDMNKNPVEIEKIQVVCTSSAGKALPSSSNSKTVILTSISMNSNIFTGDEMKFLIVCTRHLFSNDVRHDQHILVLVSYCGEL